MKKTLLFFIAIAFAGVITAFTSKHKSSALLFDKADNHQKNDTIYVIPLSNGKYLIVIILDRGVTWDCFPGGTYCLYYLKPNATPDANGLYDEDDIEGPVEETAGQHAEQF